jgi:RimJ/RimL family protein N-acetyltransferase
VLLMARAPTGAVLETERLWLRRMRAGDVDDLLRVLGDGEAMRFYAQPFARADVGRWIDWNLRNYADHGHGLWALVLKEDGGTIGDCGVTWQRVGYQSSLELEAGWHLRRDLWNRGLATEAAIRVRDHARDALGRERLIAIIDQGNLASQAVARKLGMSLERTDRLETEERLIFSMEL